MKYLILCEGTNEESIINILLDANKLKLTRDDLIGLKPYNVRQLSNATIRSELKIYNKPVIVYRIGDTQNDRFNIPLELKDIVFKENIHTFCTLPELEILMIINENKLRDFYKSIDKKPKIYAKKNIEFNKVKYNQSNEFIRNYYGGRRVELLIKNIKEYKRIKKHSKNKKYLADILK